MDSHKTPAYFTPIDLSNITNPCAGVGTKVTSGWDLVNCAPSQKQILNHIYYGDVMSFSQTIVSYMNLIKHDLNLPFLNNKTDLLFSLSDGSILVITFSYSGSSGPMVGAVYEIDFDKSTDSQGNPLNMSAASESNGGVYFSGGSQSIDMASFILAAGRAGLVIDLNIDPSDGTHPMTCKVVNERHLTCKKVSK